MSHRLPISVSMIAIIGLFGWVLGRSSAVSFIQDASSIFGDWAGESICQVKDSPCHDEKVVYHISKGRETNLVSISADKIVDGKAVNMGTIEFSYDRKANTLSSEEHGHWKFTINGNTIAGTLVLPNGTLFRKIVLKRPTKNQSGGNTDRRLRVILSAAFDRIALVCPVTPSVSCTASGTHSVALSANAANPDGATLLYTYSTTGGHITGEGEDVTWDLAGLEPGIYTATVEVGDGSGARGRASTNVTVVRCDCLPPCPTITVDCPTGTIAPGTSATVTVNLSGIGEDKPTYNWSVSAGTITSGQGTSSITIDTTGLSGQNVTATVTVEGIDPSCQSKASCSFSLY
jgi:hypothetical protein